MNWQPIETAPRTPDPGQAVEPWIFVKWERADTDREASVVRWYEANDFRRWFVPPDFFYDEDDFECWAPLSAAESVPALAGVLRDHAAKMKRAE